MSLKVFIVVLHSYRYNTPTHSGNHTPPKLSRPSHTPQVEYATSSGFLCTRMCTDLFCSVFRFLFLFVLWLLCYVMSVPCCFESYPVEVTISCKGLSESCGPKKPKKPGIPAQVGFDSYHPVFVVYCCFSVPAFPCLSKAWNALTG